MKGYAQIYKKKIKEKNRKSSNNSSISQSKSTIKSSINNYQSNINRKLTPNNILTERNASILTFSNLKMNSTQDNVLKSSEKIVLTQGNNLGNSSLINKINISGKKDPIIEIGQSRIKYRNIKLDQKSKESSLNFLEEDYSLRKSQHGKEKLKQKVEEKEKIEREREKQKAIQKIEYKLKEKEKEKDKNKEKIIKRVSKDMNKSYEKKNINYSNPKNKGKNNIDKKYNNNYKTNITKHNYNKIGYIQNEDEISIISEGSNNMIYEGKYNKKDKKKENIDLVKESKQKMLTKEEILYYTHIIFLNNATFIKKFNKYMMSKINFLNIIKSINLISSQEILVGVDLIYDSISPKSAMIIYSQFNQILMKIIQKVYPEKYTISPKLTINYFLNKLINHYNLFFENKIPKDYLYKYQYNSIVKILQIVPNENQIFIINHISPTINEIYVKYFVYELNYNHKFIYKSSENFIKFCRDFEIIPQIINSTQAMTYYNLTIHIDQIFNNFYNAIKKYKNIQNKGIIFTLIHFILFFIHISFYSYAKIFGSKSWCYDENTKIITNETKLILFLEKIEHSKGMINFLQKLSTPRTRTLSFIPSKEICSSIGIFDIYKKKEKETKFLDDIFDEKSKELVNQNNKEKEKEKEKEKIMISE